MGMLAEQADHVIGVDTHRDSHAAAAVAARTGAVDATTTIPADAFGYKRLLRFGRKHAPGRRVWAIESSGSFGSGLTSFLLSMSTVRSARRGASGRSPSCSTPFALRTCGCSASTSPSHEREASAKRSACC